MTQIAQNLNNTKTQIETLLTENQRASDEVTLIAVSKTKPITAIEEAYAKGQIHFGENYLQEAIEKINSLKKLKLIWHFIGPIQSNKTKAIAENFDWVQTVSRDKIAERLSKQRPDSLMPLNVLIQVNISKEPQKAGVALDEIIPLANFIQTLPNIQLRGLMAIGHHTDTEANQLNYETLYQHYLSGKAEFGFDTLSLGMTDDMPIAIANGSTMVRVGTAIFGQREKT